jgi:hypothetical protein
MRGQLVTPGNGFAVERLSVEFLDVRVARATPHFCGRLFVREFLAREVLVT